VTCLTTELSCNGRLSTDFPYTKNWSPALTKDGLIQ
jgi:hypothetical protein